MTRHSHTAFAEALSLSDLAQRVLMDGASKALRCNLSARECREWENGARRYLNALADGLEDEDDFAGMVDEFYNPARDQTWALGSDFLRDERSAWGMA